jgi:hypothetical protein
MRSMTPRRSRARGASAKSGREHARRQLVEADPDALEHVGGALDDGLEQAREDRGRAGCGERVALE